MLLSCSNPSDVARRNISLLLVINKEFRYITIKYITTTWLVFVLEGDVVVLCLCHSSTAMGFHQLDICWCPQLPASFNCRVWRRLKRSTFYCFWKLVTLCFFPSTETTEAFYLVWWLDCGIALYSGTFNQKMYSESAVMKRCLGLFVQY